MRLRTAASLIAFAAVSLAAVTASSNTPILDAKLQLTLLSGHPAPDQLEVFVRTDDRAKVVDAIRLAGGSVRTSVGNTLIATVPTNAVVALSKRPDVQRIEAATPLRKHLDRSRAASDVDVVHAGSVPKLGRYDGTGVIVGIVDSGLDLGHPSLFDGERPRVVAYWNRNADITCDAESITSGACPAPSDDEHGTLSTNIAAGSVLDGTDFHGYAPGADIVFADVSGPPNGTFSTTLCEAVQWIFAEADRRGQPAVINLSIGLTQDAHDGAALENDCLRDLTGPGRILVASAGNAGGGNVHPTQSRAVFGHAAGALAATPVVVPFLTGRTGGTADIRGEIWYRGDLALRVGVRTASGMEAFTDILTPDGESVTSLLTADGTSVGAASAVIGESVSGAPVMAFGVFDDNGDDLEQTLTWFVELSGAGDFDGFIDTGTTGGFVDDVSVSVEIDNRMTVAYPAALSEVIGVGSYVSRTEWTAGEKTYQAVDVLTGELVSVGERSPFSALGPSPTQAGTLTKPDLLAPGQVIISALSSLAIVDPSRIVSPPPAGWAVASGTSYASPAVAGTVALMLQADPSLDPDQVGAALRETARAPSDGSKIPNDAWGYGMLDSHAAVARVAPVKTPDAPPDEGCGCKMVGRPAHIDPHLSGGTFLLVGLYLLGRRRVSRADKENHREHQDLHRFRPIPRRARRMPQTW